MENMMKRAISAFMALVLVLGMVPGVPMFAGAEEVETQPETVAVETTEAVTVPEETDAPETTAAPETEPAETIPETTAAAETVPETTEAQETVPEETVAQEETVPQETVIEETVPEVTEEPADANDTIVLAKKIEISASKERTYVGDDVKLTATIAPSDTTETEVEWVVDGGEYILKDGVLRGIEAGVFTITAKTTDGTELESEPVEVEFVNYKMEINETPGIFPEENVYEGEYVLQTGDTVDISVAYKTWAGDESESDAKIERPLHTPKVKWFMSVVVPGGGEMRSADDYTVTGEDVTKYISWTESADTKQITMKAKLVTEYKYIMVTAEERIGNELHQSSVVFRLYPDSYKLYITDEDGNDVTNKTIVLDMANEDTAYTQTLTAKVWPEEGDEDLVWSTSNSLVELTDPDEEDPANKEMIFTADIRSGETVISVQGKEHPGVYATVTIKRIRLIQAIEPSKASAELQEKELGVGQSATLQAIAYEDREIVDNALLKWEIAEGDEAYATISDKGVLTAKNVAEGKVITVRCSVIDNEENAYFELYIPIRPKATAVKILSDTFPGQTAGQVVNGKTIVVDTTEYVSAIPAFLVETYADDYTGAGDPVGAKQEVTWKSSNTAVAAFDSLTGELIWKGKNGTTTITATAKDGSGKSASVKLEFGAKLQALTIEGTEGMFLRSGSGWTFDLSYYPTNATNKSVTWSVKAMDEYGDFTADASAIATISSNGRLSTKTVYDNHLVRVFAVSKVDPSVSAYFDVLIRPKKDWALTILDDSGKCVTKTTIMLDVGETISLDAVFVGEELGDYGYAGATWKSSSKSVLVEDGYVEAVKAGNATITAKSADGQSAAVTIKVVSKVDEIQVYQKNEITVLASGKSLDLKATVIDYDTATEKKPNGTPNVTKVTWHIEEGGEEYATVNSSGKVTAVKGYDGECVTVGVYAKATDGSGVESDVYYIDIYPAVEAMRIDIDATAQTTGSYTYYMLEPGETVGQLTAVTFPEKACDDVTWKSSNAKIAEVDEYGSVTANAVGSVTITATAADGSGKKATFKLKIVARAYDVYLNNDKNSIQDPITGDWILAIAGGKNLTIKPEFRDINGKKLSVAVKWEIDKLYDDYGTAFVKSFKNGTLVTEKVTQPKFTTVTFKVSEDLVDPAYGTPDEDGNIRFTVIVGVYPATTSLQITENGRVVTQDLWRKVGCAPFQLSAQTNEYAAPGWEWKSSNEKIAWVDPFTGEVYSTGKAGTVTITATAKDGTGKKDSVKIVFAN